jgi:hypothetical protein
MEGLQWLADNFVFKNRRAIVTCGRLERARRNYSYSILVIRGRIQDSQAPCEKSASERRNGKKNKKQRARSEHRERRKGRRGTRA